MSMLSTTQVRRAAVVGGLGILLALQMVLGAAGAGAQTSAGGRIGPNQVFAALVNGHGGTSTAPIVIREACVTSLDGTICHALKGQTVSVREAASISKADGNTGANGDEIGVFFNAPPPSPVAASGGPIIFHRYGTKPIPTSEVLPAPGTTANVYFVPLPMSPGSGQDVVIPVVYAS
jgi:hypothetical protein